jgi:alpha-tubulin suppressor-like RCC1 family protein
MNDGTVRVCGRNQFGQLGQNDVVTRSTVVSILGISSQAIAVSCGRYHTAILMNDGTVRVCGFNSSGQLGQNDIATRSTVVSILGISSQAIRVACGIDHITILMNDGTVRVCGNNSQGQLGQNDVANRSTVVSIIGISSQAIAVACGKHHTVILMNDGTVRVCGRNQFGQLGQNDVVTRSTVVSILGISSQAIAIACMDQGTIILMNDGTVEGCGNNTYGQLGQNNTAHRSTVVPVLNLVPDFYSYKADWYWLSRISYGNCYGRRNSYGMWSKR